MEKIQKLKEIFFYHFDKRRTENRQPKKDTMNSLEQEFEIRKPWISQFTINGKKYGGNISFENDPRIASFFECFPDARNILELGCLEGGQTFEMAKRPNIYIVSIEGRKSNIEKAIFIKDQLGIKNVSFIFANLENSNLTEYGKFDAVLCSGILYHLPSPWKLVREISKVTSGVFIWTHYCTDEKANTNINGFDGRWVKESGKKNPLSGLSRKSFWVTISSLEEILVNSGFANIKILENKPDHKNGPAVTLVAQK